MGVCSSTKTKVVNISPCVTSVKSREDLLHVIQSCKNLVDISNYQLLPLFVYTDDVEIFCQVSEYWKKLASPVIDFVNYHGKTILCALTKHKKKQINYFLPLEWKVFDDMYINAVDITKCMTQYAEIPKFNMYNDNISNLYIKISGYLTNISKNLQSNNHELWNVSDLMWIVTGNSQYTSTLMLDKIDFSTFNEQLLSYVLRED
jgi:hypothetical protein